MACGNILLRYIEIGQALPHLLGLEFGHADNPPV